MVRNNNIKKHRLLFLVVDSGGEREEVERHCPPKLESGTCSYKYMKTTRMQVSTVAVKALAHNTQVRLGRLVIFGNATCCPNYYQYCDQLKRIQCAESMHKRFCSTVDYNPKFCQFL